MKRELLNLFLKKTLSERKLYLTKDLKKQLIKLFDFEVEDSENRIICKGSNKNKRTGINPITFIQQINSHLKLVLGKHSGFTSHSFSQGIISEFSSKGVNIKIISKFIAFDVKTCMRYISPTDEDIMMNLIR